MRRRTGWFWATVACVAAGGATTVLTGLVSNTGAAAIAAAFGVGCHLLSAEPQYTWVTVTQTRDCERYTDWDGTCKVGCSNWK